MPDSEAGQKRHPLRPFEGSYGVMMPSAIGALIPYIITTIAYEMFSRQLGKALNATPDALEMVTSISVAGYAFGALMGGYIIQVFPQRVLFLILESGYIAGALTAATAQDIWQMGVGVVLQGFVTGLLLVVALPPVIRKFPAEKMPLTSGAINMGFFGAITSGPMAGGAVASAHAWRWYFGGLAGVGFIVLAAAALSLPDQPPMNPDKPFDWHAAILGLGGTVLPFYAVASLRAVGFLGWRFTVPLGVGGLSFIALILTQYHKRDALSPVKPMWHTYPIVGTLIAMFGGGLFVTLLDLGLRFLMRVQGRQPIQAGLAFWPLLPGVVLTALLLGLLVRTRWLPILILFGMLCLLGAAWLFTGLNRPGTGPVIAGGAALLGLGAGATVSPGLWLAGFALPSKMVGSIFALVELVRSVSDFIMAPVLLEIMHMASWSPHATARGVAQACWYVLLIAGAAIALCVTIYLLGYPGLPQPDLESWLEKSRPGLHSPPLAKTLRKAA